MTNDAHIPQEDLALFAMQALSAGETAAVRAHLDQCAECRAQVAEISGDLALVALSVPQQPVPEGARERFLAKIAGEAAAKPKTILEPPVSIASRQPAHRIAWIPWAVAAAFLLVAIALGVKVQTLNQELRRQIALTASQAAASSRAQLALDVLTAPTAQRALLVAAKTRPVPTGRAVYLASTGGLIFQATSLDPLPENRTYELWVIPANGTAPIPAGLFRPDAEGSASVVLPPLPRGVPAKAFGVTIEKAEGAATPTAPIILAGAAPAAGE